MNKDMLSISLQRPGNNRRDGKNTVFRNNVYNQAVGLFFLIIVLLRDI